MSASRRKGTGWESQIVLYLQEEGVTHAERRALNGAKDRGDVAGLPGIVIEAKCANKVELASWLDEATVEKANDHADHGVVWFKRRGRFSPKFGFVLMDGQTLVRLLRQAGYIARDPVPLGGCVNCGNDDAAHGVCSDCLELIA